jgi:hypothetical protein
VLVRPDEGSTTKTRLKNSLSPLRHFTKQLVGVFGKLPWENDLDHKSSRLSIRWLNTTSGESPATIHTQGTPQDCTHTTISKVKQTKTGNEIGKQETKIGKQETEICKQETEICKQETEICKQETEISKQETKICKQETEICKQETEICKQETEICKPETEIYKQETKICKQETKISRARLRQAEEPNSKMSCTL